MNELTQKYLILEDSLINDVSHLGNGIGDTLASKML